MCIKVNSKTIMRFFLFVKNLMEFRTISFPPERTSWGRFLSDSSLRHFSSLLVALRLLFLNHWLLRNQCLWKYHTCIFPTISLKLILWFKIHWENTSLWVYWINKSKYFSGISAHAHILTVTVNFIFVSSYHLMKEN